MNNVINGFLDRNLSNIKDKFVVNIIENDIDNFEIYCEDGKICVNANNVISACHGIYEYLKKYCNVQYSWCGNSEIKLDDVTLFDGVMTKTIEQKYRVYMNYCTLNYTMSWWDFDRWEKEIDFMAMNGINMPLAVVGTEAVWFETLIQLGFTDDEALSTVSGPAFWAWQLMTNIEGYLPPKNKKYVYERLELGKKILARYLEFGMQPIQQGFSGFVPMLMKQKYPNEKIYEQVGWCKYPKTAQLDPTSDFFNRVGTTYLNKMDELFGNHHFIACDPFHEGTPPRQDKKYLNSVGKAIDKMLYDFDSDSVWVMQGWTPQKDIVTAIPKDRLLILDLDSDRTAIEYPWVHEKGYAIVTGMLHNFGGKNAMQGHLQDHCKNNFYRLKQKGINVLGAGMFMEGIEQNPVIYDLQFEVLTADKEIDINLWLDKYIKRRYKKYSPEMREVWNILLETCYKRDGYEENRVGSCLASRPSVLPVMTGPCCYAKVFYDTKKFEKAALKMLALADEYKHIDAYQYDLCDIIRQALSNRFYTNQLEFKKAYSKRKLEEVKRIAEKQLDLLLDLDYLLSHRSETTLARWINAAQKLATDEEERKYFDYNARLLVTSWGNINGNTVDLYDYSWREWSGLIKDYYYVRWEKFYNAVISDMEKKRFIRLMTYKVYSNRYCYLKYKFGKELDKFERAWPDKYCEYPEPETKDVVPAAEKLAAKWSIGK